MNKKMPVSDDTIKSVKKRAKGFFEFSKISPHRSEESFLIVDESGFGIKGYGQAKEGLYSGRAFAQRIAIPAKVDLRYKPLAKVVALKEALDEMKLEVVIVYAGQAIYLQIMSGSVLIEEFISHSRDPWIERFFDEESAEWQSFLVEKDVKQSDVDAALSLVQNINIKDTMFYYAPAKGLYLP